MIPRRLLLAAVAAMAFFTGAAFAAAQGEARPGVLEQIRKRGYVDCGVTVGAAGFAQQSDAGEWSGFDVDFCRALAAAIFDDAAKAKFTALTARARVAALQAGWVDLLAGAAPWTQSRDAGQGGLYAGVSFHDGQGFLARAQRGIASTQELSGLAVCVPQGTSLELDLADFFHERKSTYQPRLFLSLQEAAKAYEAGQCDALTGEASALYAERAKTANPAEHVVLAELISKSPRGPLVRQGDDHWFNVVRWTLFAMIDAEELGVAAANADEALNSENPDIRRLLGVDGDLGKDLGLARNWAYRIVKHVGNYGDAFERNLGRGSPLAMERRLNGLWTKGGLMFAPPVR